MTKKALRDRKIPFDIVAPVDRPVIPDFYKVLGEADHTQAKDLLSLFFA